MVERLFVEKRPGLSPEADNLKNDLEGFLGIKGLKNIRILNRYDVEDLDADVFERAKHVVFSEPQVDEIYLEDFPKPEEDYSVLAVEVLPGQFDQRADSCSQCIQLLAGIQRPPVAYAKIYIFEGSLDPEDLERISQYLINPVEAREASLEKPETLKREFAVPEQVKTLDGFTGMDEKELTGLSDELGLAMDLDDLKFLQSYFRDEEKRNPTITEVRVVDTYWSDHCRHTTFGTRLENVTIDNPQVADAYERYQALRKEVYREGETGRAKTLMDIATIGSKALKKRGLTPELDESEEINACSIRVPAQVNGEVQDWLVMFKNETHNHPTEIEPFGGAATCIGGCIRDPLSGRAFVHQAMRLTGGADPRADFEDTLEGKLPQRKIAQTAAQGYSSYGNQIGLATGLVAELYHPGYAAKHLECGAVIGAAPVTNVRREAPEPGDVVILLGGRTGRDGIGGATGSSKRHDLKSLTTMASEVQKGNAPEERKIQRLFRNPEVTRLIKRCNDFGAGGVSVAIGELADGLDIDLDVIRKKYDGLDGTELAISESQERMAVVVDKEDAERFIEAAEQENLEAYPVAVVTQEPRMKMTWRDQVICDLSRAFLNSNGAVKYADVLVKESTPAPNERDFTPDLKSVAASLKAASRRGLTERFDGSIGAGSVLMPYGGIYQRTPEQVMAALLPVLPGETTSQATIMSFGFDPDWTAEWDSKNEAGPYQAAWNSVVSSLAKLVAAGGDYRDAYLSLQEFFERLGSEPERWGKPFQALLGALDAQMDFGSAAIGGKDSMSGSFMDLDVPPTLISFALAPVEVENVLSSAFKRPGNPVYVFGEGENAEEIKKSWEAFINLAKEGKVLSSRAVETGGVAEAVMQMAFGNEIGFKKKSSEEKPWFIPAPSVIVAELNEEAGDIPEENLIGYTTDDGQITLDSESESIKDLLEINEGVLEKVYPVQAGSDEEIETVEFLNTERRKGPKVESPRVAIPVFPGTNCEYDSARVCLEAGLIPDIVVIRNQTPESLAESAKELKEALDRAHILFIPGGFSGGDEPEGSGKFIASFFRNPELTEAVTRLLNERDGLILGICNGFQALVKLGLLPYGKITETGPESPTLTYNTIGRHQSRIVNTRVASNLSPWLSQTEPGEVYKVPVSHGEGRFVAPETVIEELKRNGQIATQYVDSEGVPSMNTDYNPNGSYLAIEGITSPDGRILGKMGHSERTGENLYVNVPGNYDIGLFKSAKEYFS